jgi:hypothetical protein
VEPVAEQHEAEQHEEVPDEKLDTGEGPERRIREPVSFAMSVAGTVAAFVAGFGILPSSTSTEKVLILVTVIGVSVAIHMPRRPVGSGAVRFAGPGHR